MLWSWDINTTNTVETNVMIRIDTDKICLAIDSDDTVWHCMTALYELWKKAIFDDTEWPITHYDVETDDTLWCGDWWHSMTSVSWWHCYWFILCWEWYCWFCWHLWHCMLVTLYPSDTDPNSLKTLQQYCRSWQVVLGQQKRNSQKHQMLLRLHEDLIM